MEWFRRRKRLLLYLAGFLAAAFGSYLTAPFLKYALAYHTFRASCSTLNDPGARVLIIAPHPDDETLAAAGIIQRAAARRAALRVVIVTPGDHFFTAARMLTKKKHVDPADLACLGRVRKDESRSALKVLGVDSDQITFLEHPDGRMMRLWEQSEQCTAGSTGPRINDRKQLDSSVGGEQRRQLLDELSRIIGDFQPTDIYYPSVQDRHPDHRAVHHFVQGALDSPLASNRCQVREHCYLIHNEKDRWPYFPSLSRVLPLVPPYNLLHDGTSWEVFSLRRDEVAKKDLAVRRYRTQLDATKGRYLIYVRREEIFTAPSVQGAAKNKMRRL